jgi:hypothetical protein
MNFDPLGLEVTGTYSISSGTLNFTDNDRRTSPGFFARLFGAQPRPLSATCSSGSGTGDLGDIAESNVGPLPPGTYNVYYIGDRPDSTGPMTYLLDPVDSSPGNDRWDGRADGISRGAFRIHLENTDAARNGSNGCLVNGAVEHSRMHNLLQGTSHGTPRTITQPSSWPRAETFPSLPRLGTLTVTP